MPPPSTTALKNALVGQGFEIYRTVGNRIVLADRVRDNLIMDSGVAAVGETPQAVRLTVRVQKTDFPGETDDQLYQHARRQAEEAVARGYREVEHVAVPVHDPGDKSRILDVWYEVTFEKAVDGEQGLFDELRRALQMDKTASPVGRR